MLFDILILYQSLLFFFFLVSALFLTVYVPPECLVVCLRRVDAVHRDVSAARQGSGGQRRAERRLAGAHGAAGRRHEGER